MSKVYYPFHGISKVKGTKNVNGSQFHILETYNGMTILAKSSAFRPLITKDRADAVLATLKSAPAPMPLGAGWTRRYRDYQDRLGSFDILEVASVFRDLAALSVRKELSFGERKILEHARMLLFSELEEIGAV